jgi:hypothetical protein
MSNIHALHAHRFFLFIPIHFCTTNHNFLTSCYRPCPCPSRARLWPRPCLPSHISWQSSTTMVPSLPRDSDLYLYRQTHRFKASTRPLQGIMMGSPYWVFLLKGHGTQQDASQGHRERSPGSPSPSPIIAYTPTKHLSATTKPHQHLCLTLTCLSRFHYGLW